ncbi:nucleotide-sugar transporter [Meredithblackwellia eburnea MCA 4105]
MTSNSIKAVSLVTLTVQNSLLTVVLHYSRTSTEPSKVYSAASAVLLNEILKLCISFLISLNASVREQREHAYDPLPEDDLEEGKEGKERRDESSDVDEQDGRTLRRVKKALKQIRSEVFSYDCWKLAVPAALYVVQNNLQFVAASNLDVPTFQITYNLKILTTAVFSVLMLKKQLGGKKWVALVLLAVGVAVVQLSSSKPDVASNASHEMDQLKGLVAVFTACMTSGLAGVYFEMVLKGSKASIWTRNIQLSIFSFIPAALPIVLPRIQYAFAADPTLAPPPPVFAHFGFWAWAVVMCQVLGGLVTALVIKYADNLLKGFATSLSIVLSFLSGVVLFNFQVTWMFVLGTSFVVYATVLYSQPQ